MNNEKYKPLPSADELFDGKTRMLARYSDSPGWCAFNPSIYLTPNDGYVVLLRSSNGILEDHRDSHRTAIGSELESPDSYAEPNEWNMNAKILALWEGSPQYHNRMFLAKFDPKKLLLGSLHEIDMTKTHEAAPFPIKRGIEDGRLYHDGESLRISATAFENRFVRYARICNFELNIDSLDKPFATGFEMFDSPKGEHTVEKNWMPVAKSLMMSHERPEFDYLYDCGYTYTIKGNKLTKVGGYELPLRGGSQLIPVYDKQDVTYLAVVHQLVSADFMRFSNIKMSPLMKRRYAHRFVRYSAKGEIIEITDAFSFLNKSIEFASGLAINEDKVFVTFGALDSSAHVSSLSLDKVLSALRLPKV